MPRIILDLSRLLSRALHATPTGVDRVEMAYARGLLHNAPGRQLSFAAVHPLGRYGRLPMDAVLRFLDRTEARWESEGRGDRWTLRRSALETLAALRPRPVPRNEGGPAVYVQASPHHLTKPDLVRAVLRRERAHFVCLIHDLIPLEYPEYARPDGAALHRIRIETVVRQARGIMANSHATLASLEPWIDRLGCAPLVDVAHLGTHVAKTARPSRFDVSTHPYFVSIGTIEPRKNHLLLLNLWRRMSEERGAAAIPKLVLIGRRGWENEQIVDMLERCPALAGCVEEHGGLSDTDARALLKGARALLMPSFAEGYGMPVTEALDLGVPVLCSALPALREAGGTVPLFLDPLDGPAWRAAIDAYTDPDDPERLRQIARLPQWERPSWKYHITRLENMISACAS